ncbi:hypothetical protein KFE25_008832 [Diacronema lutheri]|uniref:Uncharacterized protein n=1 Tax=Diacronema lutheri TaxID=2081491 RepID=A0A8J5XJK2_DIALT|nr:hypothetical protein KFE25_008832 [Diacronema lutheri]
MPGASPAVKRSNSYEHLVFPSWQIRLLMSSSLSFVCSSAFAAHMHQRNLSLVLLVAGICSLNYWRAPGASWRRDADLAAAGVGLGYCLYTGFWLEGACARVGWASLVSALACFRKSWMLSLGHCERWACWHAIAHALSGVAAAALAVGNVASRGEAYTPPRNVIAECSLVAIILTVLMDSCKPS